jgi:pimeloyl-[acyl-carrier protein] methyl ester esterase
VVPLLNGFDVEVCDLGFFGPARLPVQDDRPRIAVGHSLGALWWLASAAVPWTRLIAINAFPRFTATQDFPAGVAPRMLDRMIKRFAVAPAAVLVDFQAACGGEGPILPTDKAKLADGLASLGVIDGREAWQRRAVDIRLLAGRRDAIVPEALSEAAASMLPANAARWIEDGGHLLPLTHPEACAAFIREAAE